jgi:hypothetical protein
LPGGNEAQIRKIAAGEFANKLSTLDFRARIPKIARS